MQLAAEGDPDATQFVAALDHVCQSKLSARLTMVRSTMDSAKEQRKQVAHSLLTLPQGRIIIFT